MNRSGKKPLNEALDSAMNTLQSMNTRSGIQLSYKWSRLMPGLGTCTPEVARVLENQVRMFNSERLERPFSEFDDRVLAAIAVAITESPLSQLVSIQPFDAPISLIRYEVCPIKTPLLEFAERVFNNCAFKLESCPIQASTRRYAHAAIEHFDKHTLRDAFRSLFEEITRDVLGEMRMAALDNKNIIRQSGSLADAIQEARDQTEHRSRRTPANWVHASPSVAGAVRAAGNDLKIHRKNLRIYKDVKFPPNRIMLFRSPTSQFDAETVYSPFVFKIDGDRCITTRQAITVLNPNAVVIELC